MDASDAEFTPEKVVEITKQAIEATLKDTVYNRKKVDDWTNSLVATILSGLQSINIPFKYVVSCIIMQKTGAGLTTSAGFYWDPISDGHCTILWENATLHCVVTVYGAAISPTIDKHADE